MSNTALRSVARGIIQDAEKRILLVKHSEHKPWTLPGGHVEKGETFQDAFVREAREELGLEIEIIGSKSTQKEDLSYNSLNILPLPIYVQVIEYSNDRGLQRKYEEFFLARVISGEIMKQDDEIFDTTWMTFEEIQNLPKGDIYESMVEMMAKYFSK